MLSPNRNARLLGRLALAASTLAFAGTEIQVEAADPSSTTSSAPTWNGQEMLVAGTGFRGSNFTSLFNKKKRLPKEVRHETRRD